VFSGIVAAVGRIAAAQPQGDGMRLRIDAPDFDLHDIGLGDSIAVQGVCLTVVSRHAQGFEADVSQATLAVTHGIEAGREVNLEKSLRLSDRLGGHLVAGHVDGVGTVVALEDLGGSFRLAIEAPAGLERYVARKGSVTVDGVSLTVNEVRGTTFEVNVIPHTRAVTTFRDLRVGSKVNIEVDLLARYVEQILVAKMAK